MKCTVGAQWLCPVGQLPRGDEFLVVEVCKQKLHLHYVNVTKKSPAEGTWLGHFKYLCKVEILLI
jgi:hypothetical protein